MKGIDYAAMAVGMIDEDFQSLTVHLVMVEVSLGSPMETIVQ